MTLTSPLQPALEEALRERAEAQVDLAARLLKMSPEELANGGADKWSKLTPQHRVAVLQGLGLGHATAEPKLESRQSVADQKSTNSLVRTFFYQFESLPLTLRGIMVGILVGGFAVAFAFLAAPFVPETVQVDSDGRALCPRLLRPWRDCFYRVQSPNLTWGTVASRSGVSEPALRDANPTSRFEKPKAGDYILIPAAADDKP